MVWDVRGGSRDQGADIILWNKKPSDNFNQLWRFTQDGFIESTYTGLALDIYGGGGSGTKVIMWGRKSSDNANQRWRYDPSTELIFSLQAPGNLALSVQGRSRSEGTALVVEYAGPPHDNMHQRWQIAG